MAGGRDPGAGFATGLAGVMERALEADAVSRQAGFLQGLDPRAKLFACLVLIFCAVFTGRLDVLAGLFLVGVGVAAASAIPLGRLARQVWLGVFLFTGVIALPAPFIVPGVAAWQLPWLHWQVTWAGLRSATFLVGRAETAATFALLFVLSTPWAHVLKAMRSLGLPVALVAILGMTYRYIFVLLNLAGQMAEARRSRLVAPVGGRQGRAMTVAAAGVLLGKSFDLASEVHLAMVARGYRGEVHILDDFRARRRDAVVLVAVLAVAGLIFWWER